MGEKKEIITEVIQEDPNTKMKNSFRTFRKVMQAFEIFLIVVPIIIAIIGAIVGIQALVADKENSETNASYTLTEKLSIEVETTTSNPVLIVISGVVVVVSYVLIIILLDNLKKVFANIEKTGVIFLKENIKSVDAITIISVILGIVEMIMSLIDENNIGIGMVFLVVVLSISYIYRYGCEVQDEIDQNF